jgi:hypothetical protein
MYTKAPHKRIVYVALSFLLAVLLGSCKKVETIRTYTVTDTTAQTTIALDEVTVNSEFDQAADDAIMVMCNPKASVVGAAVDTSQLSSGIIIIDYFGDETGGSKSRTGSDSIHENLVNGHVVPWGNPGTTATITFGTITLPAYEVLFLNNGNASITFTGSATLTNVSGGLIQNVIQGDSLVEHIRATVSFTYNDNASVVQLFAWNLNQIRVFSITNTGMFASTRGDTAISGYSNIGTWGITRLGTSFCTATNSPTIQNISNAALSYNPLSGTKTIEEIAEPINCVYGVNSQGIIQASGTPYGFYITWTDNTIKATDALPYYY